MRSIKKIIARVDRLPALPGVVSRVLEITADPFFSMERLVKTVSIDPGITANVLRRINSAYFGLRHSVSSLAQAIPLLGSENLVEVVLASSLKPVLDGKHEGYRLARGELWQHSMLAAIISKYLAGLVGYKDIPTLFTACLLHDVGKLVLSQFVKDKFAEIEELVLGQSWPLEEAEIEILGVDHAELGGELAKKWNLSTPIVQAVSYHHCPQNSPMPREICNITSVANYLALSTGVAVGYQAKYLVAPPSALLELGISPGNLKDMEEDSKTLAQKAASLLEMAD